MTITNQSIKESSEEGGHTSTEGGEMAAENSAVAANASAIATPSGDANGSACPESSKEPYTSPEAVTDERQSRTKSASSSTSGPNRGGARSTSSKFASLRAAFEQFPAPDGGPQGVKNRPATSDKAHDKNNEKKQAYEAEIARLKEEVEKERELRVGFEGKVTSLEEEIEELKEFLDSRDEFWSAQNERRSVQMKNEASSQQEEVNYLQRQLADLKLSVSTSTRTRPQVSDTTLAHELGTLQHEVQNWVVNNFRRVKVEVSASELCDKLEKVAEPKLMERLRPMYMAFDSSAKLPIYQATVACYLMEIFNDPYLFGIHEQKDWGKPLRQAADALLPILDVATYHRWRAMTLDAVRQSKSIKEVVDSSAHGIAEMICITLTAVTNVGENEAKFPSLKAIVEKCISFAHLIRVQQSQYKFVLPAVEESFDPTSMDDISDESEDTSERTVRCAVFPAIVKISGEDDEPLAANNIIARANVLCSEDNT